MRCCWGRRSERTGMRSRGSDCHGSVPLTLATCAAFCSSRIVASPSAIGRPSEKATAGSDRTSLPVSCSTITGAARKLPVALGCNPSGRRASVTHRASTPPAMQYRRDRRRRSRAAPRRGTTRAPSERRRPGSLGGLRGASGNLQRAKLALQGRRTTNRISDSGIRIPVLGHMVTVRMRNCTPAARSSLRASSRPRCISIRARGSSSRITRSISFRTPSIST